MALKDPSLHFPADQKDIDALIKQRIGGKLKVSMLLAGAAGNLHARSAQSWQTSCLDACQKTCLTAAISSSLSTSQPADATKPMPHP